jgi:cytochrome c oxidase subunit IV
MSHKEPEVIVLPPDTAKIKKLWTVAAILGAVTAVEFIIAFTMSHGAAKTSLFVLLTIVKAGYIVGEFMHLRHEVKVLFWSVLVPMIFVIWMLVAFVYEGSKIITI